MAYVVEKAGLRHAVIYEGVNPITATNAVVGTAAHTGSADLNPISSQRTDDTRGRGLTRPATSARLLPRSRDRR